MYSAEDTTEAVPLDTAVEVTFVAGPADAGTSTVTASPPTVTADGISTSTITVTMRDANGNPVAGDFVFLSQGGGSSTVSGPSGTSAADGTVTFTASDTTAEVVTYMAYDDTAAIFATQTASVDFTAGAADGTTSTVTSSPPTVTADGTSTSTITVTLLDANFNPVQGDDRHLGRRQWNFGHLRPERAFRRRRHRHLHRE